MAVEGVHLLGSEPSRQQQREIGCLSFTISMYNSRPFCWFLSLSLSLSLSCFNDCKEIVYSQNKFFHIGNNGITLFIAKSITPIDIQDGTMAFTSSI